ncbi:MAG TPA: hypothetical protein VGF45_07215 [Polyangia bacterium]
MEPILSLVVNPPSMAAKQGATPPAWFGLSNWQLLLGAIGGWRQNWDKVRQVVALLVAFFRPALVRRRLARLRELGHIDVLPTLPQLLVAGRDQIIVSASEETKLFYKSQGIPWIWHNLRRFIAGPATMLDPVGLFSPRETVIHHVLQTFHRHPVYDFVLLRAHERGLEEMRRQIDRLLTGKHPHQKAFATLIEDGAYHARLPRELDAFEQDPLTPARPIPSGLVSDPLMMLGMDQFKDIAGYTRYASRLNVGAWQACTAWLKVAFDETIGSLVGLKLGPKHVNVAACDPDLVTLHSPPEVSTAVPAGSSS